ncbi:hypothetical protein A2U01_0020478, partial [Trifolium medium]|nr:hypothetical protein [Trifolium medium]
RIGGPLVALSYLWLIFVSIFPRDIFLLVVVPLRALLWWCHSSCLVLSIFVLDNFAFFSAFPEVSVVGAARPAVWRNAPCSFVFLVFLLASARRAWVVGVTRSLERFRVVLHLVVALRARVACAARRAVLLRAFWLLVPALRAGWCCAAHRLGC